MKRQFTCGHTGKGKFCHRCAEEEKQRATKLQARVQSSALVSELGIEVGRIPVPIIKKAVQVHNLIKGGSSLKPLGGKFLAEANNRIVSIPVSRNYRLVYRTGGGMADLVLVLLVTHEEYNKINFRTLV